MTTANRRAKMKIFRPKMIGFVHRFGSRRYVRRDHAKPGFECPVCTQKKLRSRSPAIYVRPTIETQKSCGSKACCLATVGTPVGMRHLKVRTVNFQSGFGFSGKTNKPSLISSTVDSDSNSFSRLRIAPRLHNRREHRWSSVPIWPPTPRRYENRGHAGLSCDVDEIAEYHWQSVRPTYGCITLGFETSRQTCELDQKIAARKNDAFRDDGLMNVIGLWGQW